MRSPGQVLRGLPSLWRPSQPVVIKPPSEITTVEGKQALFVECSPILGAIYCDGERHWLLPDKGGKIEKTELACRGDHPASIRQSAD